MVKLLNLSVSPNGQLAINESILVIKDNQFSNNWFQLDIKRTAIGANPMCAMRFSMLDGGAVTDEHTFEIN